jgi:phosphatidylethanolamine-binding protein (PEBP) family uncharacterized protein
LTISTLDAGANFYTPKAVSVASTGEVGNIDNRYQTVTISSTANVAAGDYYGYDGPCPPWNDLRLHHYIFRLYALDVPRLDLQGRFGAAEV